MADTKRKRQRQRKGGGAHSDFITGTGDGQERWALFRVSLTIVLCELYTI